MAKKRATLDGVEAGHERPLMPDHRRPGHLPYDALAIAAPGNLDGRPARRPQTNCGGAGLANPTPHFVRTRKNRRPPLGSRRLISARSFVAIRDAAGNREAGESSCEVPWVALESADADYFCA